MASFVDWAMEREVKGLALVFSDSFAPRKLFEAIRGASCSGRRRLIVVDTVTAR